MDNVLGPRTTGQENIWRKPVPTAAAALKRDSQGWPPLSLQAGLANVSPRVGTSYLGVYLNRKVPRLPNNAALHSWTFPQEPFSQAFPGIRLPSFSWDPSPCLPNLPSALRSQNPARMEPSTF